MLSFLYASTLTGNTYMTTGKTIALSRRTFVGKVMSLLFNMLSKLIITFLPRSKHLLISWPQSSSVVILEPPKIKSDQHRQHIKKQRHYFVNKGPSSQSYGFFICGSWTIKKAEHQRIDAFELWYWRRFLRVSWTARRSNQSILKKINPEYSLKGLLLKLKLQYFGHLMQRTDSLEKTLMLGKIEGKRRRGQQRRIWLDNIINSMDMNLSKLCDIVKDREV